MNTEHDTEVEQSASVSFLLSEITRLSHEIESIKLRLDSIEFNINQLWDEARDSSQRFDTLQTPLYKRLWFWIDGWPWYDLNGVQKHRPWHRGRR